MERERNNDSKSTEAGFKSAASLFTPEQLQDLRPIYAPNEKQATETTNAVIGLGAKKVPLQISRYNRQRAFPPDFTNCRNCPDRGLVEQAREDALTRSRPWQTPATTPASTMSGSSFCLRPGDTPIR